MVEFKTVTKEIKIDGEETPITIESCLFLGRESIQVALQLGRLVAPFFRALGGISSKLQLSTLITEANDKTAPVTKENLLKNMELSPEFFKTLVDQLIMTMDDKKVLDLIFRLLKGTRVNGQEVSKPEIFDIVFQANLSLLFAILKLILEENFSSFFKVSGVVNILAKMAMSTQ